MALTGGGVHAASAVYNVSAGNWATAGNWSIGTVPGAADSAFIRQNRVVTVDSNAGTVINVYLGENSSGGTVILNTGASLTATGNFQVMRAGTFSDIGGTFLMNGGSLAVTGSGLFQVGAGTAATTGTSSGTATFNGGTFSGNVVVGATAAGTAQGFFNVTGSLASLSGSTFTVNQYGRVAFTFDAAGVSMLNYAAGSAVFNSGSTFTIDGSAFAGAAGDYKLVDSSNLTWNVQSGAINITGFSGFTTQLLTADNDVVLRLTAVPEPALAELLMGSATMLLAARRNRRRH